MNAYDRRYWIVLCQRNNRPCLGLADGADTFVSVCRWVVYVIVHLLPAGIEILIQINTIGIGLEFGLVIFKRSVYFPELPVEFIAQIYDRSGRLRSETVHTELSNRNTVRVGHGDDVKTYI